MSKRAHIGQTPETHPHLFKKVEHSQVQAGDVYKGLKRSRRGVKWYANTEGQGCVDTHRQYFRPNTPISPFNLGPFLGKKSAGSAEPAAAQHAPGGACAAGPMEEPDETETAGDSISLFAVSINKRGLAELIALIDAEQDGKG